MFSPLFVCLFVCLFICLSPGYLRISQDVLDLCSCKFVEGLTKIKDQTIKFWLNLVENWV